MWDKHHSGWLVRPFHRKTDTRYFWRYSGTIKATFIWPGEELQVKIYSLDLTWLDSALGINVLFGIYMETVFNYSGSRNLWAMRIVARRVQLPHWPHFAAHGTTTISCHFMTQKRTKRDSSIHSSSFTDDATTTTKTTTTKRRRTNCRNNFLWNSCDRFNHWIHMNIACTPTFFKFFFYPFFLKWAKSFFSFFCLLFYLLPHIPMGIEFFSNFLFFTFHLSTLNFSNC